MTGRPVQHPASNSEARKRGQSAPIPHHDPADCGLVAGAWDAGWRAGASAERRGINPYRSAP